MATQDNSPRIASDQVPGSEGYGGARVLVTGAAGAIGGHLTRALAEAGAETVIAVDDLSAGLADNVPVAANVRFEAGSILDQAVLGRAFDGSPDLVFHLAALFANQNSIDHPELDLMVNGLGTLNVLQWARRCGARRVVYASTSCGRPTCDDHLGDDGFGSDSPYQITKGVGEQYCRFFRSHYGLSTVRVRLYNSYGPGELPGRYRNVIPNFFALAMSGKPLPVLGTGQRPGTGRSLPTS